MQIETLDVNGLMYVSAYAQQLEDMIAEKQEALEALREKTRAFRYNKHCIFFIYLSFNLINHHFPGNA